MRAPHPVYRSLICLYPKDFRGRYGEDLLQHFADLVDDRGARAAWTRTGVDLLATVPRYRLETAMTREHGATIRIVAVTLLAAGGVLSLLAGVHAGLVLLAAAIGLAAAGRRALALRTPDSDRRRRRLTTAVVFALVLAVSIASYLRAIGDEHISGTSLFVHNAIGVVALVGAIVFLTAGLLTPRERTTPAA